jgi:putative hydrolase of the HAD superfamily
MTKPEIRAISLDFDDTLWHARPVLDRAEKAIHGWLQAHAPDALPSLTPESVAEYKRRAIKADTSLMHKVSRLRIAVLQQALKDAGYGDAEAILLAEAAFAAFYNARQQVTLFEAVPRVLASLAERFTLISISNGNADPEVIGIAKFFSFSLSAESVGVGKPDPQIFHHALDRLALPPESVLHVGDHLLDDVFGASAVGMRTAWLNRDAATIIPVGGIAADIVIHCISQLPEAVALLHTD